jgi:hypothetical protein
LYRACEPQSLVSQAVPQLAVSVGSVQITARASSVVSRRANSLLQAHPRLLTLRRLPSPDADEPLTDMEAKVENVSNDHRRQFYIASLGRVASIPKVNNDCDLGFGG